MLQTFQAYFFELHCWGGEQYPTSWTPAFMVGASGDRQGMGGGEKFGFGGRIGAYVSTMGIASATVAYSGVLSALLLGMCVKTGEHCWS